MIHLQQPVSGWLQSVARLPDGALVKAFNVQQLSEAKATQPGVIALHRYWNDPFQVVDSSDTETVREYRARLWFDQFIDGTFLDGSTAGIGHAAAVDLVSWWNEYYAGSQTAEERALWWQQERTAARIWRDEYRTNPKLAHIRLSICAAAVGNDIPWQSAQTAVMYDAVLDYHPYDHFINGQRNPASWEFQSGRWATMDADYRARGFVVDWVFGEAGPYSSAIDGWRHSNVCGGDVGRYVEAVRAWLRDVKATAAYQQGRLLGFALFTTGGGSQWSRFETRQPELNALADMVAQEWQQAPPPPPPPPPPDPCVPRQPYKRTYVVVPAGTTAAQFAAVATRYHAQARTIGFSYDDAGHGPGLTSRTAILLGIPTVQRQAFLDWYAQYYPGTVVQFDTL